MSTSNSKKKSSAKPSPSSQATGTPAEWLAANIEPDMSYTVHRCPYGVLVEFSKLVPSGDIGALARHFELQGLKCSSIRIPKLLGLYGLAFTKTAAEESFWYLELGEFINGKETPSQSGTDKEA